MTSTSFLSQEDNARLVAKEREHMQHMDTLTDRSQAAISQLEHDRSQIEQDLRMERQKR